MKNKLKNIQERFKNNPELQEKLQEMKPKKTIWGFLGVVLLFFVPEAINFFYHEPIHAWVVENVHRYYPPMLADKAIWLSEKAFDGELSFVNIGLGFAILYWVYRK